MSKEMEEVKKDMFPQVESAVEVTKDMQSNQARNQFDNIVFLRPKKVKKQHKSLWCGLYDFFMCRRCTEKKR